jgi:hypothetical protein
MTIPYFDVLNSATKYPSIETYHRIDAQTGKLQMPCAFFGRYPVVLTEKIDGTNGRVIVRPDGDWLIGSREEILYARGDRIENPNLGIVPALLPLAAALSARERSFSQEQGITWVFFLEVYGKGVGPAQGQYSSKGVNGVTGYRLFDIAGVPADVLQLSREQVSTWRKHGGQQFLLEAVLRSVEESEGIPLTPRLGTVDGNDLPTDLSETERFLTSWLPSSEAVLDDVGGGRPEGIVLRTEDRSVIVKARFQDYARTLAPDRGRKRS